MSAPSDGQVDGREALQKADRLRQIGNANRGARIACNEGADQIMLLLSRIAALESLIRVRESPAFEAELLRKLDNMSDERLVQPDETALQAARQIRFLRSKLTTP